MTANTGIESPRKLPEEVMVVWSTVAEKYYNLSKLYHNNNNKINYNISILFTTQDLKNTDFN
jgi:hypothetical protein